MRQDARGRPLDGLIGITEVVTRTRSILLSNIPSTMVSFRYEYRLSPSRMDDEKKHFRDDSYTHGWTRVKVVWWKSFKRSVGRHILDEYSSVRPDLTRGEIISVVHVRRSFLSYMHPWLSASQTRRTVKWDCCT